MPINCPLTFGEVTACDKCRFHADGKCAWFSPAQPLSEILTTEERVEKLEALYQDLTFRVPSRVLSRQGKEIKDLQGSMVNLRNKLYEHIEQPAKEKKTKQRKKRGAEI